MKKTGFIGAGQMAQALAGGMARDFNGLEFIVSDPNAAARQAFAAAVNDRLTAAESSREVFANSDVVIIAVKPQHAVAALEGLGDRPSNPLIISIMAGVRITRLSQLTGSNRIIRVMPNTPSLVGQGAAAMALGSDVSAADQTFAHQIFNGIGKVVEVPESLIDAVTGVSGSGPAYVFRFLEGLIQGGVAEGLDPQVARELAIQTVLGAATLIEQTGESPEVLRDRVSSPGGTTVAALESLESSGFHQAIVQAVAAATRRSKELGAS